MAGNTYVTQNPAVAFITSSLETSVTQVAAVTYLTSTFSTWTTQVSVVAYVWGTFKTRVTQQSTVAWIVACDSTSYVPPDPTGLITLSAVARTAASVEVDLSWTSLYGYTYDLYRGLAPGDEDPTPIVSGLTVATYTDTGLSFGVTYYYTLIGTNVCGDTTASAEVWVIDYDCIREPPVTYICPTPISSSFSCPTSGTFTIIEPTRGTIT